MWKFGDQHVQCSLVCNAPKSIFQRRDQETEQALRSAQTAIGEAKRFVAAKLGQAHKSLKMNIGAAKG